MDNNLRINPLNYPTIKCECGCQVWNQGVILKKISGLAIGAGTEDQILDMPVYYCAGCGKIFPDYVEMYKLNESETCIADEPVTVKKVEEVKKPTLII